MSEKSPSTAAMARLENEFTNLLNTHIKFIETDFLLGLYPLINLANSSKNTSSSRTGKPDFVADEKLQKSFSFNHWVPGESSGSSTSIHEIDLIPVEAMEVLRSIAMRMVVGGCTIECQKAYIGTRELAIESNFNHLMVESLSIDEMQNLEWATVYKKIKEWILAANICFRILFPSEKKLCEQIFQGFAAGEAFYDTVKVLAVQLLDFADAVSIGECLPHKLFKILDLHDSLSKLIPDIEEVFNSKLSESIPVRASEILARLADAARGMLTAFEKCVIEEPSQVPVPGGTIHPLARYVMNYISLIPDYQEVLVDLIVSKPAIELEPSHPIISELQLLDIENRSPLSLHLVWIISNLLHNLDGKSQNYRDPAMSALFLTNNRNYIVSEVKKGSLELQEMIGDAYIKKLSGKVMQSATAYIRQTLGRILSCLRNEGLVSKKNQKILRERFRSFNSIFFKLHQNQVAWSVPDPQLRQELRIALSEILIPAYRSFLGRFRGEIENGRHPEVYMRYEAEDIENAIFGFFEPQ